MSGKALGRGPFLVIALILSAAAQADLAAAQKAYAAKDFATAFELYREIAELGNVAAQENIAAMYVDGEGVRRNNTIGFAWALIARENGGSAAMQNIIQQLQPHLDDAARARVKEITDLYGKAALENRLLPAPRRAPAKPSPDGCAMTRPVDPHEYYPPEAASAKISGSV